jgi:cell wall assembly regulator SMI1
MNLKELHTAYKEWGDPADQVFSFFSDVPGIVPQHLDLAYKFPIEEEEVHVTGITTIGLGTYEMAGIDRAELMFDYLGVPADRKMLGQALAEMVWQQLQKGGYFATNMILRDIKLAFFEKMTSLFVMDWDPDSEWLDTVPPVRLLEVVPIYESEAETLELLTPEKRTTLFTQATLREAKTGELNNPQREAISLLTQGIQNIWGKIRRWYQKNAPRVYDQLGKGASENELSELEAQLAVKLPEDFAASLRTYNGGIDVHSYRYLTIEEIVYNWSTMNDIKDEGVFATYQVDSSCEGLIQPTWWDARWIPFAKDSGGNSICIDLAPARDGKMGQIIYWENGQGPLPSKYHSFFEWLRAYQVGLYRGQFIVDQDGYIRERV